MTVLLDHDYYCCEKFGIKDAVNFDVFSQTAGHSLCNDNLNNDNDCLLHSLVQHLVPVKGRDGRRSQGGRMGEGGYEREIGRKGGRGTGRGGQKV